MDKKKKTAVVTGGSSGIGKAVCKELVRAGYRVYELSRRESAENEITHISCDITNEQKVRDSISIVEKDGIDLLICCAGFGISGAVEYTDPADARKQLDVNLFGVDNTIRAALPALRKSRGNILVISSVAAMAPIPFQTWYSVSKAAINAYASALRSELRPFGISVCAVMPGDIRTGFTEARRKNHIGDDIYSGRISRSVAGMEKDEENGMSPARAAKLIVRTAVRKNVPAHYTVGFVYQLLVLLLKLLPASLASYIVGLIYAK